MCLSSPARTPKLQLTFSSTSHVHSLSQTQTHLTHQLQKTAGARGDLIDHLVSSNFLTINGKVESALLATLSWLVEYWRLGAGPLDIQARDPSARGYQRFAIL